MTWRVPLADLDFDEAEKQALIDVLDRRWLTMGDVTREFEREFAKFVNANFAFATSNATSALHMACLAAGIGPGDEVIVPSLSFVATANAALYTGADVCFADVISLDELNISPLDIENRINERTKAIIVMHYAGYPCKMEEILAIAKRHNLAVIEDAAHAPGAQLHWRALGTWGDIGCFSFFSNKNLATGEGGMLVTNRVDIADQIRLIRSHGMTSLTWDRHQGHAFSYDVTKLGYNYRIDELHSALGLQQLKKLNNNNRRRKEITQSYWDGLKNTPLGFPFFGMTAQDWILPSFHIFPIMLPEHINRKSFMDELKQSGIQTSIHYPPIHQFSYFRERFFEVGLPVTEEAASRQVTLPLYPTMTFEQLSFVIDTVKDTLRSFDV